MPTAGSIAMTENTVLEPGNFDEHESRNLATEARTMWGDYLDPQRVTFAGLAICDSDLEISEFREPLLGAPQSDCSRVAVAIDTVIARYRVNSADALDLLCEASHYLRRALLGVAIDVIADGRLPEEAIIRARRQRTAERRLSQADPQVPVCSTTG